MIQSAIEWFNIVQNFKRKYYFKFYMDCLYLHDGASASLASAVSRKKICSLLGQQPNNFDDDDVVLSANLLVLCI